MAPGDSDSQDPYVYPGTTVLRNKLGLTDPDKLQRAELRFALDGERRMPRLSPDETGLRDAHRFLFARIYEWAGELRTCELAKEHSLFCRPQFIQLSERGVSRLDCGAVPDGPRPGNVCGARGLLSWGA